MEEKKETKWNQIEEYFATSVIRQAEKSAKRWFIAWIITIAALIGTNIYWIHMLNTYEYVYQNGEGENYYNNEIGGDVSNGAAD